MTLPYAGLLSLCRELVDHVSSLGRLPAELTTSEGQVGPGALLRGVAAALLAGREGQTPTTVTLAPGAETPAGSASLADAAIGQRLPGWPPHRRDLRLDLLTLHTELQCWSLKPAGAR